MAIAEFGYPVCWPFLLTIFILLLYNWHFDNINIIGMTFILTIPCLNTNQIDAPIKLNGICTIETYLILIS